MVTAATISVPAGARGVDSAQRLTSAQIRSLGATFTCRYYAPLVNGKRSWKALTPAEIAELHAHGIGIVPNWESSASRPLGGVSAGTLDGREFARQLAIDDVPYEALVIVSCDMNATAANRGAVEAYFRAALGELRRASYFNLGVYGDTDLFAWLADLDPRPIGWLIGARSFSDGTKRGASLWQRLQGAWGHNVGGVPDNAYDPNDVLVDVFGIWLPHEEPDQQIDIPLPSYPALTLPAHQEDLPVYTVISAPNRGSALCELVRQVDGVPRFTVKGFDVAGGPTSAVWTANPQVGKLSLSDGDFDTFVAAKA